MLPFIRNNFFNDKDQVDKEGGEFLLKWKSNKQNHTKQHQTIPFDKQISTTLLFSDSQNKQLHK